MTFALWQCHVLLCIMLLPAACGTDDIFLSGTAKATFYGSLNYPQPAGACGYGAYGLTVNSGGVCGVSKMYRNGTGCGACYQVKCKHPEYCNEEGTDVVVTDHNAGHNSEFVLALHAYAKLAKSDKVKQLYAAGVVEIQYQRIPCRYQSANLMIKVHEHSRYPDYLAIVILYQGGMYDVTSVELWEEYNHQWKTMHRAYGAVWHISNPPKGAVLIRFQVSGSAGFRWVQPSRVIPSEWKAGIIIDTALQLV